MGLAMMWVWGVIIVWLFGSTWFYWHNFGPPAHRRVLRQINKIEATIAAAKTELAALEALTDEDRRWLAHYDAMSQSDQPWPLPTVGSFWEWDLGVPMSREVIEVVSTQLAPLMVRISSPSGEREVTLDEFTQNAVPAPLGKKK